MEPYDIYIGKLPCGCIVAGHCHFASSDMAHTREIIGEWVMDGLIVEKTDDDSVQIARCKCPIAAAPGETKP